MSGGAASHDPSKAAEVMQILWTAMVGLIAKDASDDDLAAAIGAGQDAKRVPSYISMPKKVNPKDPNVIEIAKFAVKNGGTGLDFIKVASGIKCNIIAATFYALLIDTQDSTGIQWNTALIVQFITGYKKLMWYKEIIKYCY